MGGFGEDGADKRKLARSMARAVGHELNNPLTSALLDVEEALAASAVPPGVEKRLRSIAQALGHLRTLSAELQLLASAEASAALDLADVCRTVQSISPHPAIGLQVESAPVSADPARLHQLVFTMVAAFRTDRVVDVVCGRFENTPGVRVSGVQELGLTGVRADLVAAASGEQFSVELPWNLPEHVARQIGASWSKTTENEQTTFEARF